MVCIALLKQLLCMPQHPLLLITIQQTSTTTSCFLPILSISSRGLRIAGNHEKAKLGILHGYHGHCAKLIANWTHCEEKCVYAEDAGSCLLNGSGVAKCENAVRALHAQVVVHHQRAPVLLPLQLLQRGRSSSVRTASGHLHTGSKDCTAKRCCAYPHNPFFHAFTIKCGMGS